MKIEQKLSADFFYATPETNELSLTARVREAATALLANPATGASETPAERGADGRIYFVIDLSHGTAIEGDTDDDDWQPPPAVPLLASIPLAMETPPPTPEVLTYSLGGNPDASTQAQGRSLDGSQAANKPASDQASNLERTNRLLSAANRGIARIKNAHANRVALPKTQKLPPSDAAQSSDIADARDIDFLHSAMMRVQDTRESHRSALTFERNGDEEHTSLNGVMTRAALVPLTQSGPLPEERPHDHAPQTRTARYQAPQATAAASKPQAVVEPDGDDSYEVTYRFTSWSNDATVKLKLNTAQKRMPVLATPSNARVHNLLNADLNSASSRMGDGPGAQSVELAAPLIAAVSADEQNRQRQRQQPDVPDEDVA